MGTVVNKLTNEEMVKVFTMYKGSEFLFEDNEPDEVMGVYGDSIVYGHDLDESGEGIFSVDECKLLLTPLDKIADEHAIIVGELKNDPFIRHRPNIKNLIDYIRKNVDEWIECDYKLYQQAVLWGYAVPLYFGKGHWANGLDAIKLGIAIEKQN